MTLKIKYLLNIAAILLVCIISESCKKYLDAKSDKSLVVPEKLKDLQAMLDNQSSVNWNDPGAGEVSAGEYYLTFADWSSFTQEDDRRIYTWEKDRLFTREPNNWQSVWEVVFIINTVLDNVDKISVDAGNQSEWNNIKGQALYHRAKLFQQIAYIWTLAYDPATASNDLGLPLRLNSDFNEVSVRSSVQATYDRIILDLKNAIPLLPDIPLHVMRPSRPAAYALLARTYLSMRQYDIAGLYADSCLQLKNTLLDYNDNRMNPSPTGFSFSVIQYTNPEILMESRTPIPAQLSNSRSKIDSVLYSLYATNDLRKTIFFRTNTGPAAGTYGFKGSYEGASALFMGVATDEVYLMRAECFARAGNKDAALADLNALLIKRWKTGFFVPAMAADAAVALNIILVERRKELLMRGLRWMDIKRLNKEGANITLTRILNGVVYTLPPNDLRYALPLPEDVIILSGMQQNPR